jgi:hypothetical protein
MAHITSMELTNSSKLVTECYLEAAVPAFGMLVIAVMTVGSGPELTLRYTLIGATYQLVPPSGLVRPIGAAQAHDGPSCLILYVEGHATRSHEAVISHLNSIELAVSPHVVGFPRIHES